MRKVEDADYVIIGADPGMAAGRSKKRPEGKPIAVVAVAFHGDEASVVDYTPGFIMRGDTLVKRLGCWQTAVQSMVSAALDANVCIIKLAVEEARGRGAKGWMLQALVHHLVESWDFLARAVMASVHSGVSLDMPAYEIHQARVKSKGVGDGSADSETVMWFVNATVNGAERLPETEDYDYHSAVAVALAAHAIIKEEQFKAIVEACGGDSE